MRTVLFKSCLILFSVHRAALSSFFPYAYPRIKTEAKNHKDAGDPLILTPYIKNNEIVKAQNLSSVPLTDKMGFKSFAGFFTVDEKYDSNLYFWYFPPFHKTADSPVLLWLQGGPGGSSLFGLFTEIGPLIAKPEGFALRKYHWALNYHLIFIDNPVGTGFSFTLHENGYCEDETCVAKNLHEAMRQFFKMFQNLAKNDFYITGESYAGKYIPALALEIHLNNEQDRINLKGMAIGNGYCDPVHQIDYGNYLYQHGLIDDKELQMFEELQANIVNNIEKQDWLMANMLMDQLMDGEIANYSYFKNFTGFNYYYNYLKSTDTEDISIFSKLLENDQIRRFVHVGSQPFNDGEKVLQHLILDVLQSVASYFTELLSHYRVLFYSGQLDIIVAYPLTENFLRNLNFSSAAEYSKAPRRPWYVGKHIAGYVKKAGNLSDVLVRNAGHMVPSDQPKWAYEMITRFIRNKL